MLNDTVLLSSVDSGFQQDDFSGSVSYIYFLALFFYLLCFSSENVFLGYYRWSFIILALNVVTFN